MHVRRNGGNNWATTVPIRVAPYNNLHSAIRNWVTTWFIYIVSIFDCFQIFVPSHGLDWRSLWLRLCLSWAQLHGTVALKISWVICCSRSLLCAELGGWFWYYRFVTFRVGRSFSFFWESLRSCSIGSFVACIFVNMQLIRRRNLIKLSTILYF